MSDDDRGGTGANAFSGLRCPVCFASWWLDDDHGAACSHCRVVVRAPAVLSRLADELRNRLATGRLDFGDPAALDWYTDDAGARNLAWSRGYVASIDDGAPLRPGTAPAAVQVRPAEAIPHHVTLAVMTQPGDRRADALVQALAPFFARRLVLLDAGEVDAATAARFSGATVAANPLDGDYAAQRNRLQAMAAAGWVLQVDSDERPDAALVAALGWLTAAADRDGLRSLGLARRNLVDGEPSQLYPDIQYRLNRADVLFANRVHERPQLPFEETSLALVGALDHYLSSERVRARTRLYEGMSIGAGRPEDEALLLRRFDSIAL